MPPPCTADPTGSGRAAEVEAVLRARRDGDVLVLATSGTTTAPRHVLRTTGSWWSSFEAYTALSGVTAGAHLWVPGPLAGTMNLFAAVHAAAVGAHLVDDPAAATHACLTPAVLDRRGDELRTGTTVVVAGAALTRRLHDAALARGLRVAHYYGAAELSFVAAGPHADDLRPFPGVEVQERAGELWVRSPYVASGYADHEVGPLRRESGGWATVGDRGSVVDGRVVVLGRPDAVTTAGATVVLAEVEAALATVAAAPFAVVGRPHPVLGAVLTVVVTDPDDVPGLRARARTLPASHRPRRWEVRDALPLTEAGKVDRNTLAATLDATLTATPAARSAGQERDD